MSDIEAARREIRKLATLPPTEYEMLRRNASLSLGVRLDVLDAEVAKERERQSAPMQATPDGA